jgi:hypothetical protein
MLGVYRNRPKGRRARAPKVLLAPLVTTGAWIHGGDRVSSVQQSTCHDGVHGVHSAGLWSYAVRR